MNKIFDYLEEDKWASEKFGGDDSPPTNEFQFNGYICSAPRCQVGQDVYFYAVFGGGESLGRILEVITKYRSTGKAYHQYKIRKEGAKRINTVNENDIVCIKFPNSPD